MCPAPGTRLAPPGVEGVMSHRERIRRSLALALLVVALAALVAACAGPTGGPGPAGGIRGVVLLGPMCPVERQGSPCPDRPIPATVEVLARDGAGPIIARTRAGADGRFEVRVAPGRYLVVALWATGMRRQSPAVAVTVPAQGFANVTLRVDSGIR